MIIPMDLFRDRVMEGDWKGVKDECNGDVMGCFTVRCW
jgi:hypothetical protein